MNTIENPVSTVKKKQRKRFKRNRIASSEDYFLSRIVYCHFLREKHNNFIQGKMLK